MAIFIPIYSSIDNCSEYKFLNMIGSRRFLIVFISGTIYSVRSSIRTQIEIDNSKL